MTTFKELRELSNVGVAAVASYLIRKGLGVRVQPDPGEPDDDLVMILKSGAERIVEVKYYEGYDFTCQSDFPFPRAVVTNVDAWERRDPAPDYVFLVSRDTLTAAVVDVEETRDGWERFTLTDRRNVTRDVYRLAKECMTYVDLGWGVEHEVAA